jgi:hypothetical protein
VTHNATGGTAWHTSTHQRSNSVVHASAQPPRPHSLDTPSTHKANSWRGKELSFSLMNPGMRWLSSVAAWASARGRGGGGGGGGPSKQSGGCVGGGMLRERAASQPDTTPWTPAASCRIVWVLRCPRGAAPHSQVKQVGSLLQSKWGPCFKASGVLASTQVGSLLQRKWGPCFNAGGVLASKQVGSLLQRKWGPCFE